MPNHNRDKTEIIATNDHIDAKCELGALTSKNETSDSNTKQGLKCTMWPSGAVEQETSKTSHECVDHANGKQNG
jgi:hypothetical protein